MKKFYFSILFLLFSYVVFSQDNTAEVDSTKASNDEFVSKSSTEEIIGFKIYPNPVTNGILNISTLRNYEKRVQIFDVLGKQVINRKINTTHMNIDNLKPGVYILRVTENNKTATRKLVIK